MDEPVEPLERCKKMYRPAEKLAWFTLHLVDFFATDSITDLVLWVGALEWVLLKRITVTVSL